MLVDVYSTASRGPDRSPQSSPAAVLWHRSHTPRPMLNAEMWDVLLHVPALRACMHLLLIVCFLIAARTRISDNFAAAICLHLRRRPGRLRLPC